MFHCQDYVVRCRLDRAAANTRWAECFPSARCQYLGFEGSDYKPLISFFAQGTRRRRGMFRYDRRLWKKQWCEESNWRIVGSASPFIRHRKLASTRSAISAWNWVQQHNSMKIIEQKKAELNESLSKPIEDTARIQEISPQLNSAYQAEEEFWRQRSRLLWLKLGDRNTGFFHAITKTRKRANAFSVLEKDDGIVVHKEEEIVQVIGEYFDKLFTTSPGEEHQQWDVLCTPSYQRNRLPYSREYH